MTDQTTNAETATLNLPGCLGFDLGVAAELGSLAKGVEIGTLKNVSNLPGLPAEVPVALRRGDMPTVESLDRLFEPYRIHPTRKTGTAQAQTFESFCDLTNRHKTGNSAIFANIDWRKPTLTTVIDYHEAVNGGKADFAKHRIHYPFPLSEEWKKWVEKDGDPMQQNEFAWFLEDRIVEVSSPTEEDKALYESQFNTKIALASQLVELSRGLSVRVDATVKAATTLQTGEGQIAFEETHKGDDGKPLKVPGLFMLYIAPFFMGEKVRIPVRLRYRPVNGKIVWFYNIFRPDQFVTQHIRDTLFEAADKTGLPTYSGSPESGA